MATSPEASNKESYAAEEVVVPEREAANHESKTYGEMLDAPCAEVVVVDVFLV